MEMLLLIGLLALNVAISWWNCYAVGVSWKDVMAMGNWFDKTILWSGVIQSVVGFSMPILLVLAYGAVAVLTSGQPPYLTLEEGRQFMDGIFSLWYLAVIFPVLGSGLAIWAHSLRAAYQRRDFASIATAGWNTYAQISNTLNAYQHVGGAFNSVGQLFSGVLSSKDSGKAKLAFLALIIVVLALVAGVIITFTLVRHYMSTSQSRLEEYGETLSRKRGYA
ncbi:hypothetical protein FJY93_01720 [Candidatus Kaiserbacteria bacterium]|nr:hypothetical protein [Candidatus Kaiserbacteria bacterium]